MAYSRLHIREYSKLPRSSNRDRSTQEHSSEVLDYVPPQALPSPHNPCCDSSQFLYRLFDAVRHCSPGKGQLRAWVVGYLVAALIVHLEDAVETPGSSQLPDAGPSFSVKKSLRCSCCVSPDPL